jgi:hypothetical protein
MLRVTNTPMQPHNILGGDSPPSLPWLNDDYMISNDLLHIETQWYQSAIPVKEQKAQRSFPLSLSFSVGGTIIAVRIGMMFTTDRENIAIMVPNYKDDPLYVRMSMMDDAVRECEKIHNSGETCTTPTTINGSTSDGTPWIYKTCGVRGVSEWVLFRYKERLRTMRMIDVIVDVFGALDNCLPFPNTLRIPIFGADTNTRAYDSASAIVHAVLLCVQDRTERKVSLPTTIELVIPPNALSGTILAYIVYHLFEFGASAVVAGDTRIQCGKRKRSVLHGECFHRLMCYSCATKHKWCQTCGTEIDGKHFIFLGGTIDCTGCPCAFCKKVVRIKHCGIFVPCGHRYTVCSDRSCVEKASRSHLCPICNYHAQYKL